MADVFLDPRLPDYFEERSWSTIAQDHQVRDAVISDFLSEKISFIHGFDLGRLDLDFLGGLHFPQTWQMKKFIFPALLRDVRQGVQSDNVRLVRDVALSGDQKKFEHLVQQFGVLESISKRILDRLFENYHVAETLLVSRFSETRMENLHFDMDEGADDHEAFRLYINLDGAPRLWGTSYQLTELVEQGGCRLTEGLEGELPGETLLKRVVTRAFGGWAQRATERIAPRHLVFFDPGDLWIVDGRTVSHQVFTGHRVFTTYVRVPHASNPGLRPGFGEKFRQSLIRSRLRPLGAETAIINYFNRPLPRVDIKGDWEEAFGKIGTGRLRRFTDLGLNQPVG